MRMRRDTKREDALVVYDNEERVMTIIARNACNY